MNLKIQLPSLPGELAAQYFLTEGHEKPTIIFLHDSLGCTQTWRTFPKELAEQLICNYFVYDRLGYGASSIDPSALKRDKNYLEKEADILLEIIEKIGITKPILFGHSDGASIALIAAAKGRGIIQAIISEAAHIFVEQVTLEGIQKVKNIFQIGDLRNRLIKYHGSKVDEVFGSWANTWLSDSFKDWNIESFLPNIECPCMILQGSNDEYGSMAQIDGIKSGIKKNVTEIIIEDVGHSPHKEKKDYVLKITTDFIKKYLENAEA